MRFFNIFIVLLSLISLSACAGNQIQNGKLNAKYVDAPLNVTLVEVQNEEPLGVKIPVTNVQAVGGGLIGALVVTAINVGSTATSAAKRMDEKKALLESINKDIYDRPGQKYARTIKGANWLDAKGSERYLRLTKAEMNVIQDQLHTDANGEPVAIFGSQYLMGEFFESMTQNFRFTIAVKNENQAKDDIYTLNLSETYYPAETNDTDLDNYKIWLKNNNNEIKKGVSITTERINDLLKEMTRNPYSAVESAAVKSE